MSVMMVTGVRNDGSPGALEHQRQGVTMMKLALMKTATGKEDPEVIRVTSLRNCNPTKCFTKFK